MRRVAAGAVLLSLLGSPLLASLSIQQRPGQRWALIVGRDEDDGGRTASELRELSELLRRAFGYTASHMLERYDKDASADQVREAMSTVLRRVEPPDSLLLMLMLPTTGSGDDTAFVTHGGGSGAWTLLPLFELQEMVSRLPARASLVVLSGCQPAVQQVPPALEKLAYSRSGDSVLTLLAFCPEVGTAPAVGRSAFARELRGVLETAPTRGEPLNVATVIERLQSREASFRIQRPQSFPVNAPPQFAFIRQGGRLDPLLDALSSASTDKQKESAIAALVSAVREEPEQTRAGAVAIAGPALLPLATGTSVGDDVSARAALALGEIGYQPAVDPLALLLTSRGTLVRRAALDALIRMGGDAALPYLKRALRDPDPAVQTTAIRSLGARKQEDAFPELLRLTSDASDSVKVAALQAIASFPGHQAEIRQVAEGMLADQRPTLRREAASVLGGLGPSRVSPVMLTLLRADPDAGVRQAVAYSIGRSFVEADRVVVGKALTEAAREADPHVREAALWALGSVGGAPAERALRNALKEPEPSVRRIAVEKLGDIASSASVPDLIRILGVPREPGEVRQAAAGALGQIGDSRALEPLLAALKDDNAYVRGAADTALQLLKGPPAARFVERLRDPAPRVRAEAAQKLGESGTVAYLPRLVTLLADDDETVRQSAVRALARFQDPAAEQQLMVALADKDFRIRQGAVAALALAGRAEARPRLLPLLKDPVGSVRAEAVRGLGRLGWAEHRDVLDAVNDEDAAVRLALAETLTLAPLSSSAARETLLTLARDPAVQVRQVAVGVLIMRK